VQLEGGFRDDQHICYRCIAFKCLACITQHAATSWAEFSAGHICRFTITSGSVPEKLVRQWVRRVEGGRGAFPLGLDGRC